MNIPYNNFYTMDLIRNANVLEQKDITTLENNNPDILYTNSLFWFGRNVTRLMLLVYFLNKYPKKFCEINSIIKEHIKKVPEEINIVSENGQSAINMCIVSIYSRIETAKILLNGNANVNFIYVNGTTILHKAAYYGKFQMIKLILEYDSMNISNSRNKHAIDYLQFNEEKIKFNKILEDITLLNRKN